MASSIKASDLRCLRRAHSRKAAVSTGRTPWPVTTRSSQKASASAFVSSRSRVISMPAWISPTVAAGKNNRSAGIPPIRRKTSFGGVGRRSSQTTFVSRRYNRLLEGRYRAVAVPCARRRKRLCLGFGPEEQFLEIRLRHFSQSPPLLNWQKHRRRHATLGHDLRSFPGTRCEKLAEPGLRLVNLPCLAPIVPQCRYL